jgi:hypothetical protein
VFIRKDKVKLHINFFSCIAGIEAKMLLIIVLGLISKLTLVSGSCVNHTSTLTDFDWNSVGISVSTC